MHSTSGRTALIAIGIVLASAFAGTASAKLGGHEDALEVEGQTLQMKHSRSVGHLYTVHELAKPTGTIKEFALPNGTVFAVSWRGMKRPDLASLFGDYYQEYDAAEQKAAVGRSPHGRQSVLVKSANLQVRRGGHMRDIHGQAVILSLVPEGVNPEDLQ